MSTTTTSVVVCTRGTSAQLLDVLSSLARLEPPAGEVLVVHSGRGPIPSEVGRWAKIVEEPRPGLALARQRALEAACGDVVAFVDDDVTIADGWLAALTAPLMASPRAGMTGGAIEPVWPGGRTPSWVAPSLLTSFGHRAAAPQGAHPPFGGNMALRRAAALDAGGFTADLGHHGLQLGLHEDSELADRLQRVGYEIVDTPAALVLHHVREEQVHLRWVLRRAWAEGRSDRRRDRLRRSESLVRHAAKGVALLLAVIPAVALTPIRRWVPVHVVTRLAVNLAYVVT